MPELSGKILKPLAASLLALTLCASLPSETEADPLKKSPVKKGRTPPIGWQYQPGFTVWRTQRGLGATPQAWRKYVREKRWRAVRGKEGITEKYILNSLDWTVEELRQLLAGEESLFLPSGPETTAEPH